MNWDLFFAEYELAGSLVVLHEYERVVSARIIGAGHDAEGDGLLHLHLCDAYAAPKLKGDMLLGKFAPCSFPLGRLTILEDRTTLEDVGNGTFYFDVRDAEGGRVYGFLDPLPRLNVACA